jgi:hypothetical protein
VKGSWESHQGKEQLIRRDPVNRKLKVEENEQLVVAGLESKLASFEALGL